MKYPEFINSNSKIGFIAPSFGCASEPYSTFFDKALEIFRSNGYTCIEGPNTRIAKGIGKSNTATKCGEEINDFFSRNDIDLIISAGGGETMCEDLNYVDFAAIADSRPRWFLGYSDNTNLTFTLPVLCDTAAVYGPCASKFGELGFPLNTDITAPEKYVMNTWQLLCGNSLKVQNYTAWELESLKCEENPFAPLNAVMPFELSAYTDGTFFTSEANILSANTSETCPYPSLIHNSHTLKSYEELSLELSGRLIGGCLDCLVTLVGTHFDKTEDFIQKYNDDGILWFIETCDLNVMGIRRALWQLDNAGWFSNASGFLFGRPGLYNEVFAGADRFNSVIDILGKYNVPIIFDLDFGHHPPQMPIISGALGKASVKGNHFEMTHILL